MKWNICCTCFSRCFEGWNLPDFIRNVVEKWDCNVCWKENAWRFYARQDEIDLAKEQQDAAQ